jgi:hypothetical protein
MEHMSQHVAVLYGIGGVPLQQACFVWLPTLRASDVFARGSGS